MFREVPSLRVVLFVACAMIGARPALATQFAFTTYTPEQGLAATAVFKIEQDDVGHLWFATSEGVSRFDGVEFRNFDVSTGLPDQRVYSMVRDRDGRFWFGHSDGVSLFDGHTLRNFSNADGIARGVAWSSTLDRFGHPWFGTQNGGVSVWTGTEFITYGVKDGLPEDFIYGLFADTNDRLWIGSRYEGIAVAKIDGEGTLEIIRTYTREFLGARGVRDFREDPEGNIFAATRGNGVVRFDGETLEPTTRLLEGVDVYTMLITSAHELVVGRSFGGLDIFTLPDLRPRIQVGEREGLPAEIFSLFEDRERGLWIGTGIGVVRWPSESIMNFDRRDGIVGTFVLGVCAEDARSVWVASAQGASLLTVPESAPTEFSVSNITRSDGLPSEEVWYVLRDRKRRLWIATAGGLCLYDESRGCQTWTEEDGLPSDFVSVLLEGADGRIWIGAAGGAAWLDESKEGKGRIVTIGSHPSLDAANVYAIVEIGEDLWIATDAGLFVWKDERMSLLGNDNGLPRRGVNDVLLDERGDLWVATSGLGIGHASAKSLNGPQTVFSTYGVKFGLPSNTVISLVAGDEDTIWAGTGAGIVQIDARLLRDGSTHFVRRQLTSASGLLGSEPGSGSAFCRTSDGVYWFGLARGVSRYDPTLAREGDVPPIVEIGRVIANREPVYIAPFDSMTPEDATPVVGGRPETILEHKTNDLRFEYRGLSFQDPSRIRYQTKLEGLDDEWSAPTTARVKEFTHLPSGEYIFRVRAISAAGLASKSSASYSIKVRPPFWATDWFPVVLLVSMAFVIAMSVQLRSFAVKKHNLELSSVVAERTSALRMRTNELEIANARILDTERAKSRFLAGMSHELRTPLNSIIGFTELMLGRESERDQRESKFLGNVNHSAHQLLAIINDLLDLSKIEAGKMEVFVDRLALPPLVESVLATLEPLSTPRRVNVERCVPDELPVVQLDTNKVRQILYNLLSNAIRFSPPGSTVRVTIKALDPSSNPLATDAILMEVEDRGIGIPLDEIHSIFDEYHQSPTVSKLGLGTGLGLSIVKKFAELQGGAVQVEPNDESGSTFRVWLPQNALEYETDSGPRRVVVG